jgi:hypothetical protein
MARLGARDIQLDLILSYRPVSRPSPISSAISASGRIAMAPRSSLIITDEGLSSETGKGTDFVVLMSGEPQGGIKMRKRPPETEVSYSGYYDRPMVWRSSFSVPFSTW